MSASYIYLLSNAYFRTGYDMGAGILYLSYKTRFTDISSHYAILEDFYRNANGEENVKKDS